MKIAFLCRSRITSPPFIECRPAAAWGWLFVATPAAYGWWGVCQLCSLAWTGAHCVFTGVSILVAVSQVRASPPKHFP